MVSPLGKPCATVDVAVARLRVYLQPASEVEPETDTVATVNVLVVIAVMGTIVPFNAV